MRRLYFDVDGTILRMYTTSAKPALANGVFERAIRRAGIEEVVCVGNYVAVALMMSSIREDFDPLGAVFEVCAGVFEDEEWFRTHTKLVSDPDERAAEVDLTSDWWYVDDLAEKYFLDADRADVFQKHLGVRIAHPPPRATDKTSWIGCSRLRVAAG